MMLYFECVFYHNKVEITSLCSQVYASTMPFHQSTLLASCAQIYFPFGFIFQTSKVTSTMTTNCPPWDKKKVTNQTVGPHHTLPFYVWMSVSATLEPLIQTSLPIQPFMNLYLLSRSNSYWCRLYGRVVLNGQTHENQIVFSTDWISFYMFYVWKVLQTFIF